MKKYVKKSLIEAVANYVAQGEKHGQSRKLGVELEHILVDKDGNTLQSYAVDGRSSSHDIMRELSSKYQQTVTEKDMLGYSFVSKLIREDAEVSCEPGGQLEVAFTPMTSVLEVAQHYQQFYSELSAACAKFDCKVLFTGCRPDKCALEVGLIQKKRYMSMDARLKDVGTHGPCMMRNSASVQVSIDYQNHADCFKKLKIATCIAPLIYFLFDNTLVFERRVVGTMINPERSAATASIDDKVFDGGCAQQNVSPSGLEVPARMARYKIWQNTDKDRVGSIKAIWDDVLNAEQMFLYKKYAEQALKAPLIYAHESQKNLVNKDFCTQYADIMFLGPYSAAQTNTSGKLTTEEIEHVLSMGFYDARLKNFIELRAADCVPPKYMFAYVAFIQGLSYSETALDQAWEVFKDVQEQEYVAAGEALYKFGWEADVYGKKFEELITLLLDLANSGLSADEQVFLKPMKDLVDSQMVVMQACKQGINCTLDEVLGSCINTKTGEITNSGDKFEPVSITSDNTKAQLDHFLNAQGDLEGRTEALATQKESKAIYNGKIMRRGYFSKIYALGDVLLFSDLVATACSIFNKVIDHYYENPEYAKLFNFDDFTAKLVSFRPKYSSNFPIGRLDAFYNDETGRFEFCEFNAAGSAAMNEVFHICKAAKSSSSFCALEEQMFAKGLKIGEFELFESWCKDFVNIYNEWCENVGWDKFAHPAYSASSANPATGRPCFAIVDFLDNCAINDFYHFVEAFAKLGYNAQVVDIHELEYSGGALRTKKGQVIDAFYKRVTLDDLYFRRTEEGVDAMIQAVVDDAVCPIDWYSTQIVHSKQICYVLSHPMTEEILTPSEREFVRMHQPLTYDLTPEIAQDKRFVSEKDSWLCKPVSSRGAKNIYPGSDYSAEEWAKILCNCAKNGNHILQRYATQYFSPNVCIDPYDDEQTLSADYKDVVRPYSNMEGLYSYDGRFAGIYLRQGKGSINSSNFGNIDCATFWQRI